MPVLFLPVYLGKKKNEPIVKDLMIAYEYSSFHFFSGRMRDNETLRQHKVVKGSKIMLVGSTVNDVMSVTAPDPKVLKAEEKEAAASKTNLSKQKVIQNEAL